MGTRTQHVGPWDPSHSNTSERERRGGRKRRNGETHSGPVTLREHRGGRIKGCLPPSLAPAQGSGPPPIMTQHPRGTSACSPTPRAWLAVLAHCSWSSCQSALGTKASLVLGRGSVGQEVTSEKPQTSLQPLPFSHVLCASQLSGPYSGHAAGSAQRPGWHCHSRGCPSLDRTPCPAPASVSRGGFLGLWGFRAAPAAGISTAANRGSRSVPSFLLSLSRDGVWPAVRMGSQRPRLPRAHAPCPPGLPALAAGVLGEAHFHVGRLLPGPEPHELRRQRRTPRLVGGWFWNLPLVLGPAPGGLVTRSALLWALTAILPACRAERLKALSSQLSACRGQKSQPQSTSGRWGGLG